MPHARSRFWAMGVISIAMLSRCTDIWSAIRAVGVGWQPGCVCFSGVGFRVAAASTKWKRGLCIAECKIVGTRLHSEACQDLARIHIQDLLWGTHLFGLLMLTPSDYTPARKSGYVFKQFALSAQSFRGTKLRD